MCHKPDTLQEHAPKYEHIVAVVDPPRAGLHRSVLRALLACAALKRLVFVSCNPDTLVLNAGLLCAKYRPDGAGGGGGRGAAALVVVVAAQVWIHLCGLIAWLQHGSRSAA